MPFDWPSSVEPALKRLAPSNLHVPERLPKRGSKHFGIWSVVLFVAAIVLFLLIFDWNWLRPPVAWVASEQLNREVKINGDLDVHPWSLSPSAEVHGITISQPDHLKGQMASAEQLAVKVKLLPLFRGQQILEVLEVRNPVVDLRRDADGRNNWTFGDPNKPKDDEPTKIPAIQHFWVRDGQIEFNDAGRNLRLTGTVNTSEHTVGPDKGSFSLDSEGTINSEPFTLKITGAPLLRVTPDTPYPFKADMRSRSTHATADAVIDRPFDLGHLGGRLTLSGPDLADLYRITGLALPNTPPYRVTGRLRRDDARYDFDNFDGRIGDSDISGDLYVRTDRERPYLNAQARSSLLDFDDIGPIFGLPPSTARGETASAEQKALAGVQRAKRRLLPDATLNVERIRAMDADVTYRAERVNAPGWPLRRVQVDLALKEGVLTANPVSFDFSRGSLDGRIKLDASGATPRTDFDLRLFNARLEDWIKFRSAGQPVIEGKVVARARLTGYGDSIAKTAATADGQVTLAMPNGRMRQAFAELLGINVTKGLIMLLGEDPQGTPIRCAVADFKATNGVLNAQTLVVDTGVVVANGEGRVDMRNETMDFRIDGDSKEFRLVRLLAPITVGGSWTQPKIGIEAGPAIAQGVIGLGLGALLHPLAAIIPFIEPGGAEDADCAGLLAQAAAKGAR